MPRHAQIFIRVRQRGQSRQRFFYVGFDAVPHEVEAVSYDRSTGAISAVWFMRRPAEELRF